VPTLHNAVILSIHGPPSHHCTTTTLTWCPNIPGVPNRLFTSRKVPCASRGEVWVTRAGPPQGFTAHGSSKRKVNQKHLITARKNYAATGPCVCFPSARGRFFLSLLSLSPGAQQGKCYLLGHVVCNKSASSRGSTNIGGQQPIVLASIL